MFLSCIKPHLKMSPSFLISVLFITLPLILYSPCIRGEDLLYESCEDSFTCGSIKDIGYPFSIFVSNQILNVSRNDLLVTKLCTYEYENTTRFDLGIFNYTSHDHIITMLYGCDLQPGGVMDGDSLHSFPCLFKKDNSVSISKEPPLGKEVTGKCESVIQVPVINTSEITTGDFSLGAMLEALGNGFELHWNEKNVSKCNACKNSSRKCGYDISLEDFTCLCRDGPRSTSCEKSKKSFDIVKMGFLVNWKANNCSECEGSGGPCGFDNNGFVCFCSDGSHQKTCSKIDHINIGMKIGIGICVGGGFVAMTSAVFFVLYVRHRKKYVRSSVISSSIFSCDVPIFDYDELARATNNFDSAAELGDGGFGTVYKGKLRDGRVVAVKRLYEHNCKRVEQFMNEVDILARLRHPNLISLYGCTSRQSSRLLLVYEYISNGTVADHIHGDLAKPGLPPWLTRLNIAVETATALVYLHASDVIHRDLKTNNILLDENFTVKVADFGLSRLFPLDVTHITTTPQGTPGYVDPEYHQCYQLTEKSDVYSFGVMLIELISSLPAVDIMRHRHEINLSALALNKIQANALHELVDGNLGFQSNENTREMITAVAELAFQCLQPRHNERPSMQEVLETLKCILKSGCKDEKADDTEDTSDDAVLLKNNPLLLSPDSVTVKWVSTSSTSTSQNAIV